MISIRRLALVGALLLTLACKKEQEEQIDTPLKTFLANTNRVDTTRIINAASFEFGTKFYASQHGSVTHLGCYVPYKGNIRVSLWDFASQNLIAAVTITADSAGFVYGDIPDVPITANQRYVISINNTVDGVHQPYYLSLKKGGNTSIYPFTSRRITYEALLSKASSISVFPGDVTPNNQQYIGGYGDFKFK